MPCDVPGLTIILRADAGDRGLTHRDALAQAARIPSMSIDWGRRPRGQGKRSGYMVMGAMSDGPTGVKSYTDFEHAEGVTPEVWEELRVMPDYDKAVVIGALQAGYSVVEAFRLGYQEAQP